VRVCARVSISSAVAASASGTDIKSLQETHPASKLQRPIRGGASARLNGPPLNQLQQVTNVGPEMVLGKMSGKVTPEVQ